MNNTRGNRSWLLQGWELLFQDYFIFNIISLFILTYLFLVGESCYHRWTILAFCVLSKSEEINARKKRKVRKEACVGWLLPAITARTAIKMEEWRRGCLTVLSCQLPNCLLSRAYLFNLRNQHFFHGPILKCSFLKTSSFHVPRLFFFKFDFYFFI